MTIRFVRAFKDKEEAARTANQRTQSFTLLIYPDFYNH